MEHDDVGLHARQIEHDPLAAREPLGELFDALAELRRTRQDSLMLNWIRSLPDWSAQISEHPAG